MKSRDDILTSELKRGDRAAQKELYDLHSASLMAIAMRYVGERSAAEDLMHDVFIKIFNSIKGFKYRGEGSLKAWMSRIMVNSALEYLRLKGRNRLVGLDEGNGEQIDTTEAVEVSRVPQERLLSFIADLPDGYRTVLNLFCIEGYSHKEIAEELGINEKSSSSQLLRAKRLLATRINSYIRSHEGE